MKKYVLILAAFMIIMIFAGCTNSLDGPVGPAVWIKPDNEDGSVNWDNYLPHRILMHKDFDDGTLQGFYGDYQMSTKGWTTTPLTNQTGDCLTFYYTNLQPWEGELGVSCSVLRNGSIEQPDSKWCESCPKQISSNFLPMAGEGEILVFEFKARCSNDNINNNNKYDPIGIEFQLDLYCDAVSQAVGTNVCNPWGSTIKDYSKCTYKVPGVLPSNKWTNIRILLSDFERPWTDYPQVTAEIWIQHVEEIVFTVPAAHLSQGQSAAIFIDDLKMVIYRHKSLLDPTQY